MHSMRLQVAAAFVAGCLATAAAGATGPLGERTIHYVGPEASPMYLECERAWPAPALRRNTIVFVHGANHSGTIWSKTPDNRDGWARWFQERRFRTCIVDLPGRGRSPTLPGFPALSLQVGADALREALAITGPAILVGHSMGSQVVQRAVAGASAAEKARIAGVLLVAPVGPAELIPAGAPPFPTDVPVKFPDGLETFFFAFSGNAFAAQWPIPATDNYLDSLHPESAQAWNEILVPGAAPAYGPNLFGGIPTLVVGAEGDNAIPFDRVVAAAAFWGVELRLLGRDWNQAGNGHLFMVERNSDAIVARLHEWLQQKGLARTR